MTSNAKNIRYQKFKKLENDENYEPTSKLLKICGDVSSGKNGVKKTSKR